MLFQLYPFIYCDIIKENIVLYNSLTKDIKVSHVEKPVSLVKPNAIVIEETEANRVFIEQLGKGYWGIIDNDNPANWDLLIDYPFELKNYYFQFFSAEWEHQYVAKKFIRKVIVNLSARSDILACRIKGNTDTYLMTEDILYPLWEHISEIENLDAVVFNITLTDYLSYKEYLPYLQRAQVNVIIHSFNELCLKNITQIIHKHQNMSILVLINNLNDYMLLRQCNLLGNKHIRIGVSPNSVIKDLELLLEYGVDDVLKSSLSVYDAIRNEWYNTLFWGNLYINAYGNIMMNEKDSIGNLANWSNIQFNKLLSDSSFWRMSRIKHETCKECFYRNLCPPISEIEIYTQRNFCVMGKMKMV